MRKSVILSFFLLAALAVQAQLQSPADFLGYEIGTEFSRHADVVRYFEHVAANSDMVTYQEYGKTNERRPLTYAIVTSPANQNNIEQIRKNNLAQTGIIEGDATSDKAIVWLSYNVHGNEASSTEASMVTLYELITTKKDWLDNTVIIIDPCVNPDGRDRYANWYNQVASKPYDPLQIAAEHNEPWPGGRPNHYLFDLNRDWAWATQVESQQRLKVYNQWMPQIHVDFHEQGINEPYYFAPAAEPFHEVITDFQRDFQNQIGKNHAKYFDNEGWLYFTKERFDLLYPSYGDTYPTYMGAIGMTYEQAGHGRAGLGINNDEGFELTLVDRVAHHKTTGLSTVEVASNNVQKLNTEFQKYFDNNELTTKSFVLTGNQDNLIALANLLDRHEIQYGFTGKGKASGVGYDKEKKKTLEYDMAMVVNTNQPKGKMVQVLFEPDAKLSTPLTYDITAWNLPKAYGLEAVASSSQVESLNATMEVKNTGNTNNTATGYIAKWNSMQDARFLAKLLKAGIKVRFTEKPFVNNGTTYDRGSLIITKSDNMRMDNFGLIVNSVANEFKRELEPALSSFATSGPDFGSPDVKLISAPRVALLRGERTSSLSYGATWYFFEQDLGYPVTSIDTGDLGRADLSQFDVLVMPDGYYGSLLNDSTLDKVKTFVRSGGKVVALSGAVSAFAGKEGFGVTSNEKDKDSTAGEDEKKDLLIPYASREESGTTDLITGSIFKITMDKTHPMAFGYGDSYYSLKLGSDSYSYLDGGYNVGWIPDDVVNVSGFAGDTAKTKLKNSMVFGEQRLGAGSVIYMVDDPLFRAFWENGKLLFVNSVFLVNNNRPEL
ncbi:Zinc carboxypeptidase [Nonlabens sp. Hel1_33_55]|uniref:M14 family metallopeptidase n=1 Tax=Nonlabens sp. Hel1_33_55 TaxID=1336802 RepID=UPI000875D56A|nr:M14 family metallopeptidase [Nonlabens sp. Hel1_33_55]SCY18161.1 Zinc carboxypeptidase [Nonlabens sp. Hel1_33_55]